MPGAACRGLLVLVIERGRKKPAEATWGFVSAHVATNSARQDRDRHNAPEGAFDLEAHAGPRIKTSERGVTIQVERERERERKRERRSLVQDTVFASRASSCMLGGRL